CFLKLAGVITSNVRFLSAHCWERMIPASIVFPNPTSSAKIAPCDNGDLKANKAASIWWGFKSTWASCKEAVNLPISEAGNCLVKSYDKYLAWYLVNIKNIKYKN